MCRFVNAYCPHTRLAKKNPNLLRDFYNHLNKAVSVPARWEVFTMGDFNSKLGKLSTDDIQNGLMSYMGKYGNGSRNDNGESLLNFIISKDFFTCNTAFQHKSAHVTTYTGTVKDWSYGKRSNITKDFYSQIDYILCRRRSKSMLVNSRSFRGTTTDSDHRIVITKINLGFRFMAFKRPKSNIIKYDSSRLASDKDVQTKYQACLGKLISSTLKTSDEPNQQLATIVECISKSAVQEIGIVKRSTKRAHTNDPQVVSLVEERHKLRLLLNNNDLCVDRKVLRRNINQLKRKINRRLKEVNDHIAETLAKEITSTDSSRRMFEAVRQLADRRTPSTVSVTNDKGEIVGSDSVTAEILRNYFEKQYNNGEEPLAPFDGPPKPLTVLITPIEVEAACKKLKNGRATGPDNIPNELLRYAGKSYYSAYANMINQSFETNSYIDSIGQGIITPFQKPGKPKGPLKSLRPLTLSNGVRKVLSLVTLLRIGHKMDRYTGPWQAAYKHGRSCNDLVWCQRMLVSVVQNRHWEFSKMGIDMSSAFDTISRQTVLNLLIDAGCTEDEVRLVRLLLSNTKLHVRIGKNKSTVFISLSGAFQGDSLSGCLFTLTLAGALIHLRAVLNRPNPPISDSCLPLESEYADDVDFLDEDPAALAQILPKATSVLKEWSLNVNEQKTEFVRVYLAGKNETDSFGVKISGNEPWRCTKLLGSLLCSTKDILHRIQLGNVAFANFSKIWLQGRKISLKRKLLIYEAQVVSVIMYGSCSWAAPKHILEKLNICHRHHLRSILNVRWPHCISNKTLYKTCEVIPLTDRVDLARWTMLGHVLRLPENSPAAVALTYSVDGCQSKPRLGRHQINLFNTIKTDLSNRGLNLENLNDMYMLRDIAKTRTKWKELF
ncbi:hypothetical protein ACHWQZ_G014669 [Mnemiopsis leidyi]